MKRQAWLLVLLIVALAAAACGPTASGPKIRVENVWGRPSPKIATAGAFYMTIYNDGTEEDRLIAAESPACTTMELHESFKKEDGTMGMRPVEGGFIAVPAGGSAELKVGGLHVMCLDKKADFKAGDKYPITLKFEKSGAKAVEAEIKQQ
ncbi:MAG: copper chaperone PCu(A)C [Anaerolineae bacterium]|nr:copper chaperone PCu(A)C [Anaerolineae bacterium]